MNLKVSLRLKHVLLFIFFFQTLLEEMRENSRINTLPKDFDEEKILDIAAHARQRQEIMKLKVITKTIKMWSFDVVLFDQEHNIKSEFADLLL